MHVTNQNHIAALKPVTHRISLRVTHKEPVQCATNLVGSIGISYAPFHADLG